MKLNPGNFIAGGLFIVALAYLIHWWVLLVLLAAIPMAFIEYGPESQKRRKATRMKRELRRNAKNHNTQVLADMYDERHGS